MAGSRLRPALAAAFAAVGALALMPTVGRSQVMPSETHAFRVVTVADGLLNPWSIAFLPGGDMLVTEKAGALRIVRNGVLLPEPVPGVPTVRSNGQGGLLDVAPHPDFESNRLIYLSFSKPNADGSEGTTAVVRGRFENDRLADVEEIFEARAWSTRGGHYGSRLVFDDDGFLFITVGDRQAPSTGNLEAHPAQDLSSHQGSMIRLHDDGRVPSDNPFVGQAGALPEIWSYGHRSPQGLAIHPQTGELWETEHGPQGGDELNLIRRGANFGWPVIGYGVNYGSGSPIHASASREGMEIPVHYWVPSIATSGLMIYDGDAFPGWRGSMFVGGLAGEQLARVKMEGARAVGEETLLDGYGRIRDIVQGPDGFIYIAVNRDGNAPAPIVRLEPAGED
ncbi:MAG: PQQ-dependent sugar dehydrogenase [Gemmatimonadota bacterium]